ncbi:DUF3368 domain-containing protein [Candidatus Electronema sp. TJ]|uniref:DUF3368 domain-containing protein n=1 Tax=Candidatus Electronema sp. TJ TaxID=3401573 RepID=UPI003AA97C4A
MILIADSSALIALAICDGLQLLEPLYGEVLVPEAVYNEVALSDKAESATLREYLHGKVRTVDTSGFVYLDASADLGETEAMLLYKQLNADKLLIDDRRGRKIAKINKIHTIGSLGVLLAAKNKGLLAEVLPSLMKLNKSSIFISPDVIQSVLDLAGEKL